MSTIDTSTWNPDADLNVEIEGIPLNSNASIAQTWQIIRILMAAFKGDTSAIEAMMVPFSGATASADGASGLVPAPEAGDQDKVLKGDGTWGTASVSSINASAITSGTIDLARLPAGALERLVTVADQTARYALTTADVQLGDTVKQLDTGIMYLVVDTTKLGQAAGYVEYTAGSAASVPWSGVTGKPSSYTPSSHTHGSITNDGKLGTASRVVVTDGSKAIGVSSVTSTELGYLSGVTSAVQTQISGKADDSAVVHKTGNEGISGTKTFNSQIVGTICKSVGNDGFADMIQTYQSDNDGNRSCTIRCTNGDGYNAILIGAHDESNNAPNGLIIENRDGAVTGGFTGSLRLTRTVGAQGTQDNSPALSIGSTSGTHLELDDNEIMAKASGTTTGALYLNRDGGDVYIGGHTANHKSVTGRGKGSSTVPVYTNADGVVTACGTSLDVGITGNAATATKLATPRTINGVSFDGSANITVEDSTKVSKSGGTLTGALNGRASNVNLAVEPSSAKEDWRFSITKSSADTTHTGNLMRLGVAQGANTKDYRIMLGVSNPRAGNLPTQESIAGGTDDADADTGNCWGGIGVYYDYSKNRAYPYCYNLNTCELTDDSTQRLATNYWVRHATGNFACNAASASTVPWSGVTGKPPTLAGYGITDARIASGVITLGSNTITPLTSASSLNAEKLTGTASVDTTGNAATATKLATPVTINGVLFDGSANIAIEDSAKLPLAGGTMTGEIVSSNGVVARRDNTEALLALYGGTAQNNGGKCELYGGTRRVYAGAFQFTASIDSSTYKQLRGEPGGTLVWDGQAIQTASDERRKTSLSAVPDEVLDAWEAVGWGQFRFLDAVEAKGKDARLHLGLIAQHVKAVFEERGLDACEYGILCHEERPATEEASAVDLWMIRYTEALALEAACQRRRADRLEARIAALEAMYA